MQFVRGFTTLPSSRRSADSAGSRLTSTCVQMPVHALFTEGIGISLNQVAKAARQPSSHDNRVQSWVAPEVSTLLLVVIVVTASSELPVALALQLLTHKPSR